MCAPEMHFQPVSPCYFGRHQMWLGAIQASMPQGGHESHHCFSCVCCHIFAIQVSELLHHVAAEVVLVDSIPLEQVLRHCNLGQLGVVQQAHLCVLLIFFVSCQVRVEPLGIHDLIHLLQVGNTFHPVLFVWLSTTQVFADLDQWADQVPDLLGLDS